MPIPDELKNIIKQLPPSIVTDEILETLCKACESNERITVQIAKYINNINQADTSQFGDTLYQSGDSETKQILLQIKEFIQNIDKNVLPKSQEKPASLVNVKDENFIDKNNRFKQLDIISFPTIKTFEFEVVTIDDQGREKRSSKQAEYFIETLSNGIGLEMVYIPSGKFTMGAPREEEISREEERPQHIVNIKSFFIGRYPITQAQWRVVANLPQINRYLEPEPSCFKGDNLPVERVSWYYAQEFCQRLLQKTGRKYRLPTEAEWEYACRAITSTPFHCGKTITTNLVNYCSQSNNINGIYRQQTIEVGSFPANNFGLCDMHGLVWEWCEDCEHEDYLDAPSDGSAWINYGNEEYRILRGGSWDSSPNLCRSASRFSENPSVPKKEVGFRVVFSEI